MSRGSFCLPAPIFSALTPELKFTLDKVITSNKVVLFMKGTKDFPQCGFSNTVVRILKSFNVPFETINVLEIDLLRQALKEYSNWTTFPQLYLDGEFFGGCDITRHIRAENCRNFWRRQCAPEASFSPRAERWAQMMDQFIHIVHTPQ